MTDMTDETKGDGMTLEHVRDFHRTAADYQNDKGNGYMGAFHSRCAKTIDAHLAAQSAMRVDDLQLEFSSNFMDGWLEGERDEVLRNWGNVKRAALQAAIGKPQP